MKYEDMETITNLLIENRVANLPIEALAEVFDRLIWCLSDNGEQLLKIKEEWLKSSDIVLVELGLAMNETYPFDTMKRVFLRISSKWPEFSGRCSEILQSRIEQVGD